MNHEGTYFLDGFLHNLCPCFDITFIQLGVITRTRNKFVQIVAVVERCLIITDIQNNESKEEKISSYLIYNIMSLSKMAGKIEPFS